MRIRVLEICPVSRVLREDGERVRQVILEHWRDGEMIEVDFENERIASLSFLDEAIAVLFLDHPREEVLGRIKATNLVTGDRDLLNRQVGHRIREAAESAARAG